MTVHLFARQTRPHLQPKPNQTHAPRALTHSFCLTRVPSNLPCSASNASKLPRSLHSPTADELLNRLSRKTGTPTMAPATLQLSMRGSTNTCSPTRAKPRLPTKHTFTTREACERPAFSQRWNCPPPRPRASRSKRRNTWAAHSLPWHSWSQGEVRKCRLSLRPARTHPTFRWHIVFWSLGAIDWGTVWRLEQDRSNMLSQFSCKWWDLASCALLLTLVRFAFLDQVHGRASFAWSISLWWVTRREQGTAWHVLLVFGSLPNLSVWAIVFLSLFLSWHRSASISASKTLVS